MLRKIRTPLFLMFFITSILLASKAFGELELVGKEGVLIPSETSDWEASLDGTLRLSYNCLQDVVTLGDDKKMDNQNYMGEQYSLGLDVKYKEEYEGYLKLASFGCARYDANVLGGGPVYTIWGPVDRYHGEQMLPRLQEWWLSMPLVQSAPAKAKAGLFTYSVGSGLALGGYYENYGANLAATTGLLDWTFHFAVPDIENKWIFGPKISHERERFDFKYNSRAYFFAGDVVAKLGEHSFQPYLGVLIDRTPAAVRTTPYATPVNTDILGTYGGQVNLNFGDLSLTGEGAANFGKAWSIDPEYPDMVHCGWMYNAGASYSFFEGRMVPRAKFYYISGNKFVGEDITDGRLVKSANREFSNYSPLNQNLSDSFYPAFSAGPYVFAGMGNSLNQGILRPNTFGDPYQMTNLVTPDVGVDLKVTDKLTVNLDYWYLRSAEPGIGAEYDELTGLYSPYTLPAYLGNEFDIYAEYEVNKYITFSFLGGLLLPGDYFRKNRGDADLLGISPAPRYDGGAANPWMIEAAVNYRF